MKHAIFQIIKHQKTIQFSQFFPQVLSQTPHSKRLQGVVHGSIRQQLRWLHIQATKVRGDVILGARHPGRSRPVTPKNVWKINENQKMALFFPTHVFCDINILLYYYYIDLIY